jgi:hypothetical protein
MPDPHPWPPASDPSKKGDLARYWCRLVCTCFVVGCAYGFLNSLRSWQEETHLSKRGILTTGLLTDRRIESGAESDFCYVSYRFSLSEPKVNTQFRKEQLVSCFVHEALHGVRFVDVRFLPEDPRVSRLELEGSRVLLYSGRIVLSLVGGTLGLLMLISEATGWAPSSQQNQWVLDHDGVWRIRPRR